MLPLINQAIWHLLQGHFIIPDYRQAHFSFEQALRFPENQEIDLLSYFTADDCIDGDVTPFITLDGDKEVLEGEPKKGIYECTVSVTNSVGYMTTLPDQCGNL